MDTRRKESIIVTNFNATSDTKCYECRARILPYVCSVQCSVQDDVSRAKIYEPPFPMAKVTITYILAATMINQIPNPTAVNTFPQLKSTISEEAFSGS